jgi:hypothetical protein
MKHEFMSHTKQKTHNQQQKRIKLDEQAFYHEKKKILEQLVKQTHNHGNIPCHLSSYSLGIESVMRKVENDTTKTKHMKQQLITQLNDFLIDMQIILVNYFKNIDIQCGQVVDFLKEMIREMIYCKMKKIKYNHETIYERTLSTLSESTLHNHNCFVCGYKNGLRSCRMQCTDVHCIKCHSKIEVKMKKNTQVNKEYVYLNSGIPEGVATWKHDKGELLVFKENGYSTVNSKYVDISTFETHKNSSKQKKTQMKVRHNDLKKININVLNWNNYKTIICQHLNKIHILLFNQLYAHNAPVCNAIDYFMLRANRN